MKAYVKAALYGLVSIAAACTALLIGREGLGLALFTMSAVFIATSLICESIEKRCGKPGISKAEAGGDSYEDKAARNLGDSP